MLVGLPVAREAVHDVQRLFEARMARPQLAVEFDFVRGAVVEAVFDALGHGGALARLEHVLQRLARFRVIHEDGEVALLRPEGFVVGVVVVEGGAAAGGDFEAVSAVFAVSFCAVDFHVDAVF